MRSRHDNKQGTLCLSLGGCAAGEEGGIGTSWGDLMRSELTNAPTKMPSWTEAPME